MTPYEYSEEEHRRIQERDKTALKEQLAASETKLAEAETNLKQSESKLTLAIQNTIAMLQSMDYDDSFIRSKLCKIYQLSEADAMDRLKKYNFL